MVGHTPRLLQQQMDLFFYTSRFLEYLPNNLDTIYYRLNKMFCMYFIKFKMLATIKSLYLQ